MSNREQSSFLSVGSSTIYGISLVLALLAPIAVRWTPSSFEILSAVWFITNVYAPNTWIFQITIVGNWSQGVPISFIRCLFAYQVKRYYEDKGRLGPTIILGWMVECFLPLFYIINAFLGMFFGYVVATEELVLPTPLMVVVAWFLMSKNPRGDDEQSWVEKELADAWGDKITGNQRSLHRTSRGSDSQPCLASRISGAYPRSSYG